MQINQNLLKDNKIVRWPKKEIDKKEILEFISQKIPSETKLKESEINEIILQNILFDDYILVRRELVERKFISRTKDCREYWKNI